jgi:hypothetical protein
MKYMALFMIALVSFTLKGATPRIKRLGAIRSQANKQYPARRNNHDKILKTLLENNRRLDSLLSRRSGTPVIWEQQAKILTGKVFRGTLLNSINSTNLASPVLVLAGEGQGLPPKTKFSCQGVTQNKRVLTLCSKMVTPNREISIQAQILNMDGSSGLVGEYDDGKDQLIAGAVISDFAQGMLSAAQTRFAGPLGAVRDDSVKNQLLQGAVESGRTTSEILLEEMKTAEPVVTVEAGEEVLIYFMEAVNED